MGQKGCGHSAVTSVSKKRLHPWAASESKSVSPLEGMHAEFSSQLINYAVLTLATVSLSLCKHEAVQNGKGVGRAGCQDPVETREQLFEYWMVFTPALEMGSPIPVFSSQAFFIMNAATTEVGLCVKCIVKRDICNSSSSKKGISLRKKKYPVFVYYT